MPGEIIGGFTTYYGPQQGKGRAEAREHNILLGCERIDGVEIPSNASFSFNDHCAPYRKSSDSRLAPNISADGIAYGGGIFHVTTTLYRAARTLPPQIEEWSIHRYNGVSYVPQFYDAAVGTYSDLVFRNTLPYAIRIAATARHGAITVFIIRA